MAANRKSSDDLHRLIHSLSTEEKGFFVKFARRQVAEGSKHLELFNIISKQPEFNAAVLKEKFRHYAIMKVYLKEMILDSLLLYYRRNHSHLSLLNLIEKCQVLIIKGFNQEALKILEKAIEQASKMELFDIKVYLLNLHFELGKQGLVTLNDLYKETDIYKAGIKETLARLNNLAEVQLISEEWRVSFTDHRFSPSPDFLQEKMKDVGNANAASLRAAIKKSSAMHWLHLLNDDLEAACLNGEEQVAMAGNLKAKHDSSFSTIPFTANQIITCVSTNRFARAEKLSAALLSDKSPEKYYRDMAFVRGTIGQIEVYLNTGKFAKGLAEITRTEELFLDATMRANDKSKPRLFIAMKILFLFLNEKYSECWLTLQEQFALLSKNQQFLPNLLLLQLMVQFEMGNYTMLKPMAMKAEIKMKKTGMMRPIYEEMLQFFKNVAPHNLRSLSAQSVRQIKKLQLENKFPVKIFNNFRLEHWLESKYNPTTLEDLIKAEGKRNQKR